MAAAVDFILMVVEFGGSDLDLVDVEELERAGVVFGN